MSSAIPSFPTAGLECFALSTFVLLAQLCYINQSGSSQCLWPKESSWLSIRATHYLSTAAQAKPWQNSSSLNLPLVLASTPSSAPLPHLLLLLALQFQPRQQKNCWKKRGTIFIPAWKKKKKSKIPNSQHCGHLKWKANMIPASTSMRCHCLNSVNMELDGLRRTE